MIKIVMIGAGSAGFCLQLVKDILYFDSLKNAHIVLMDIDEKRLKIVEKVMNNLKDQEKLACTFSTTTDLQQALKGASFAISMIQVGGLEPYKLDIEIPLKYGVDQCVGDTVNPGGLFRGLRHIPAYMEMLRVMERVCPDVVFMNYTNPMAISTWAIQKAYPHIRSVGLCHGVQHTTAMLCEWLGIKVEDCEVLTAGINHMAWFLVFRHKSEDLYPLIWEKLKKGQSIKGEGYRFEIMKATGHFMTETSGHLSEYLPYFRNRKDLQDLFGGPGFSGETRAYLNMCIMGLREYNKQMQAYADKKQKIPFVAKEKSVEYAADIINAVITDRPLRFAGNILNKGFITNLPPDCCVEIPVYADRLGLHGSYVGHIPDQCAALCQSNISFQGLAVKAGLQGDFEAAFHACLLDPLTAAVLAPHEIRNMVDEMFAAQMQWLPQFRGRVNENPYYRIGRMNNKTISRDVKKDWNGKTKYGHYDK